nr:hypothetical protein [Tanacetum cinerariifolium]
MYILYDEAEVINPYMDDGSNNPPPPNSKDEETHPTSPVIPDADGQPIPLIASFGQNFHFGCENIKMDRTVRNVMSDLSGLKKKSTRGNPPPQLTQDIAFTITRYEAKTMPPRKSTRGNPPPQLTQDIAFTITRYEAK